ncbi:hypothetical protein LZ32DRAFT_300099 [Colletotrichum eremochloae]|nr:hypothetical protein LZ32DRAFT_300099 [Colletotrichum eremochloae]
MYDARSDLIQNRASVLVSLWGLISPDTLIRFRNRFASQPPGAAFTSCGAQPEGVVSHIRTRYNIIISFSPSFPCERRLSALVLMSRVWGGREGICELGLGRSELRSSDWVDEACWWVGRKGLAECGRRGMRKRGSGTLENPQWLSKIIPPGRRARQSSTKVYSILGTSCRTVIRDSWQNWPFTSRQKKP